MSGLFTYKILQKLFAKLIENEKIILEGEKFMDENLAQNESIEEAIAKPVPKQSELSTAVTKAEDIAIQDGLKSAIQRTANNAAGIKELARDLTYLKGASDLQSNEEFKAVYDQALGKQLVEDLKDEGVRQAIVNAAKAQEAKNLKAQAYYDGWKPVFDLLGIEKPFGVTGMHIVVYVVLLPFLFLSLCRFLVNGINSLFTAVSKFTKPAMIICSSVLILVLAAGIGLSVCLGIDSIFGTSILPKEVTDELFDTTYSVTYCDGTDEAIITMPVDETAYKQNDTITLTETIPEREGYTFVGWLLNGQLVDTNNLPTITKNLELVAKWEKIEEPEEPTDPIVTTYKVTYHANYIASGEETEATEVKEIDLESAHQIIASPFTREGFTFLGWAETAEGEVEYKASKIGNYVISAEQDLYAIWEEIIEEPID